VKLNLDLNFGDGYLVGNAANDFGSYKINIQQGWPDTTLIMPSDLNLNAGQDSTLYRSRNLERLSKGVSGSYGYTEGFRYILK
jgi:hypothetical protein